MNHPKKIKGYNGTIEDLAKEIGNLRYDYLNEFLEDLELDIRRQADNDKETGRIQLADRLYATADNLKNVRDKLDEAWKICEPYIRISK